MSACASSRIGRRLYRFNTLHALRTEMSTAESSFSLYLPISRAVEGNVPPLLPSYFGYRGEKEAEGVFRKVLNTAEMYLNSCRPEDSTIPTEDHVGVCEAWQIRLDALFRLGEVAQLESEALFCIDHYKDEALLRQAYIYVTTALAAQGKVSEAELWYDKYIRIKPSSEDDISLLSTRIYLDIVQGDTLSARSGLETLLSEKHLPKALRALTLRRRIDLARELGDKALALSDLSLLRSLLISKSQVGAIDAEKFVVEPISKQEAFVRQWIETAKGDDDLRTEVIRILRDRSYDAGDFYEALLFHEKLPDSPGQNLQNHRDSIMYGALIRFKPDIRLIHVYGQAKSKQGRYIELAPLPEVMPDTDIRQRAQRSFRDLWGNVPNYDFWAMTSDRPAFDGETFSTEILNAERISVETYQSALIRVGLMCIELLSDVDKARTYFQRCVTANPESPEAEHALRLLHQLSASK